MRTIKLNRIKTTKGVFEDFWDSEGSFFVVYSGYEDFGNQVPMDAKIEDHDGVVWDCYLWATKYIPKIDIYEIKYKVYGD